MTFHGLGLLLRLPFPDNNRLSNRRTFLVIEEDDLKIKLLNVSSIQGKEHKLMFESNKEIIKYKPPFNHRSMVKLDSLYEVEKCPELNNTVLCRSQPIDSSELQSIITAYQNYSANAEVAVTRATSSQLVTYIQGVS